MPLPTSVTAVFAAIIVLSVAGCAPASAAAVATVNGEEITQAALDERVTQARQSYEMEGMDLSDEELVREIEEQALTNLITETVVLQEATRQGFTPEPDVVGAQYQAIADRFDDEETFASELAAQGLTTESLRERIADSLAIGGYLESVIEGLEIEVTEGEVAELYELYQAQFGDQFAREEIEAILVEELRQSKENTAIQDHIHDLEEGSEIEVLLDR